MNILNATRLATIAAGCLALAGLARAQGHGGGFGPGGAQAFGPTSNPGLSHMSTQGLQNSALGRDRAQSAINQRRLRERRAHKSELRQDRLELQQDRNEFRQDRFGLHEDRQQLQQDKRAGDLSAVRADKHEIRQDRRELFHERRDLLKDKREVIRDTREVRQERRDDAPFVTGSHIRRQ